jgi:TatD DNase family protein
VIDAHNHLQDPRFLGKQDEIIATMKEAGITACVVNGTSEADWPEVAKLAEQFPDFVHPAFGLHPWKTGERSPDWLSRLNEYLKRFPEASIGECGLDRWMESPNLEEQHKVFRKQLELALSLNRPVTIHCLKAWGPLISELKDQPHLPRFLLHSFGGSMEIAQEATKLGAYFSFSGYFLQPRKLKVREVFAKLPIERILVETDAPDMALPDPQFEFNDANHPGNLAVISCELAKICDTEPKTFTDNTRTFLSGN